MFCKYWGLTAKLRVKNRVSYLNRLELTRHSLASLKIGFQSPQATFRWWMSACAYDCKTPRCNQRFLLVPDFSYKRFCAEFFPAWAVERSFQPPHCRGSFLGGSCYTPVCWLLKSPATPCWWIGSLGRNAQLLASWVYVSKPPSAKRW